MANTSTQIYIQPVFTVQYLRFIIRKTWENALFKYITDIIQNHGHQVFAINGMQGHLHAFFGMRHTLLLFDLMQNFKENPSKWINKKGFLAGLFSWLEGFGDFLFNKWPVGKV